jgi:hypothetical protein
MVQISLSSGYRRKEVHFMCEGSKYLEEFIAS